MIVYNITIKIPAAIETEWVQWQKQEHIPDVMASGHFTGYSFYRLLEQEEADDITYIVQYFALSLENYNHYIEATAPLLRQKAQNKWGNQFIAFRTIMEVVN
jgi:hypothetical protein